MTRHKLFIFSVMGVLAMTVALMPENAWASNGANVGSALFDDVTDLVRGNLGVVVGLILSLVGLWMWLVQQASWGLVIVVGGAALTAFPGIYASISKNVKDAFGDSLGTTVEQGNDVGVGGR